MSRSVRLLVIILLAIGVGGLRPLPGFAASTVSDCPTTESALSTDISNAGSGGTVAFTCTSPTTIPFTTTISFGTYQGISQGVTLDGSGATGTVTFDGGGTTQLFNVGTGGALTVKALTLAHGDAGSNWGGAIYNNGTLTISDSTLSGNSAEDGGAIENDQTLTITNSTFSGNAASKFGGAISNPGALTIASSTFSGNSATYGGAINDPGGAANYINGIYYGEVPNAGNVSITASTLSGNSASSNGGAIYSGAIFSAGTVTITASTLSGNSTTGGAIYNFNGTVTIGGSIIANGSSGGNCYNHTGTITETGYNLSDDGSCGFSTANHDLVNTNPQLGPLANNGGPTQTMALLSNSPAMDQIPLASCPSTDQRGDPRPDKSGESACDIGAFES